MLNFLITTANVLMVITSLFLICLVLIQRGKGGGLAGAFGGVGGSSAFGTKAGDVFTRVTIYAAFFWFVLALFLVYTSNSNTTTAFNKGLTAESAGTTDAASPDATDAEKDKDKGKTPLDISPVGKPASSAPATAPVKPAVPLNPANAGAKATSDQPSVPAKKP
ncbi:MAG: protein translocase, SecG subunit [Planctomycetota bacterium]|nr:protein translocase, SecG subunit [Planctomycetota bacterium]